MTNHSKLDHISEYLDNIKKSAYLEPSEKDAQLQPRAISCKLSRHQKRYQHQKALDCLSRLAFQ